MENLRNVASYNVFSDLSDGVVGNVIFTAFISE